MSSVSLQQNNSVIELVKQLESDLDQYSIDREYRDFAKQNQNIHIPVVAAAYAWNWFRRGESYRGRTHGMSVRFHDLRDLSSVSQNDGISEPKLHQTPIDWGKTLFYAKSEGLIIDDTAHFCDTLRAIRKVVQTDKEYKHLVDKATEKEGKDGDDLLKHAVSRALISGDIPPPFKKSAGRGKVIEALSRIAGKSKLDYKGFNVGQLAYEIVDLGINSKLARKAEFELRDRFYKRSLWKVFRIPGRD